MVPSRYIITAAIIGIAVAFFAIAAFRSWRTRAVSQGAELTEPLHRLNNVELLAKQAHYVATSYSSNLLKRIVAFGLGNRGRCDVFSGDSGIVLVRKGEPDLAIETKAIISVELADHAIDRGVEADGLIRINWLNGEIQVSTFIRAATRQQQKMIFQKFHSLAAKEAIK